MSIINIIDFRKYSHFCFVLMVFRHYRLYNMFTETCVYWMRSNISRLLCNLIP